MSERAALEAAIAADPDRVDNYLVLADVLTAAGDPRGELTVIMHRNDPALAERRRELIDADVRAIFGATGEPYELTYRLGWPHAAALDLSVASHRLQLATLLDHPAARYLAELDLLVATTGPDDPVTGSNLDEVLDVVARRPRPLVRALSIREHDIGSGRHEPGWLTLVEVECAHAADALWPSVPNLTRLRVGGSRMFHALVAPALRELVVAGRPFCEAGTWQVPALHAIDATLEEVGDLATLCGQPLPALRVLAVHGTSYDPDSMFAYAEVGAVVRQLAELRVPVSFLAGHDGELAAALERHADELSPLASLVVTGVDRDLIHRAVGADLLPNLTLVP